MISRVLLSMTVTITPIVTVLNPIYSLLVMISHTPLLLTHCFFVINLRGFQHVIHSRIMRVSIQHHILALLVLKEVAYNSTQQLELNRMIAANSYVSEILEGNVDDRSAIHLAPHDWSKQAGLYSRVQNYCLFNYRLIQKMRKICM